MNTTARTPADILLRPFQTFFRMEASSGILLLAAAVVALVWANTPLAESYFHLWEIYVTIGIGDWALTETLHHWINDGLMAIFFFVIGLEIKREILVGELSDPRKSALTVAAAIGGMLVPAGIYALLNAGSPGGPGWGIPMATDIAFAIGVLALLGSRAPTALKVFLTAVAIVDDLGAVLVIAFFYTAELSTTSLGVAALFFVAMMATNRLGIRSPIPYFLLGVGLWLAFLYSGVHATIAGVVAATTIPARRRINAGEFVNRARGLVAELAEDQKPGEAEPTPDQRDALHSLEVASRDVETPLSRLEHGLHPWVAFFIMPVFALANAGVALGGDAVGGGGAITLGILLGLFFGKQIGVLLFAFAAVKARIAALPSGTGWLDLYGVALLCGIGFTMSLFIANLAFPDAAALLDSAKVGILAASTLSGIAGVAVLLVRSKRRERGTPGRAPTGGSRDAGASTEPIGEEQAPV